MSDSTQQSECDDRLLRDYLDGLIAGLEQVDLENHLNWCAVCRRQMESLAADGEFWATTTQALDSLRDTQQSIDFSLAALSSRAALSCLPLLQGQAEAPSGPSPEQQKAAQTQMLQRWLEPSDREDALGRIGKYEVLEVIGQGGMGLVLKAMDTELNREVAIKTMAHHISSRPDARMRLAREARAVAGLSHPHIVTIYGMETWRDVPLIIMPLIAGGTLDQYAAQRTLSVDEILSTALQIASALSALHAAGIIHRDLKPSNILLKDGLDHILLSDFGLARTDGDMEITHSDALAGTPHFMSPEQALGKSLDVRSDLFSFGSVIYWLCTRQSPFPGGNSYETLAQIVHAEPSLDELERRQMPSYLRGLIAPLLAKDAGQRWASAERVAELLQNCLAHHRSPEHPLPVELMLDRSLAKPQWRASPRLLATASVATLGLAAIIYAWINGWGSTASRPDGTPLAGWNSIPAATANPIETLLETSNHADRYGPLDELDRQSMIVDLAAGKNLHYWLRRMAYLEVDQIPTESLPAVQTLVQHSDLATRELAQVILNKNPFQEVNLHIVPDAMKNSESSTDESSSTRSFEHEKNVTENPFQEVTENDGPH